MTSVSLFSNSLFETHPDVQDMFLPFRNLSLEEMKQNAQLRGHALKVMGTVEKALARMEEPEKLAEVMHALGQTHAMHNVKPELVDVGYFQIRPVVWG